MTIRHQDLTLTSYSGTIASRTAPTGGAWGLQSGSPNPVVGANGIGVGNDSFFGSPSDALPNSNYEITIQFALTDADTGSIGAQIRSSSDEQTFYWARVYRNFGSNKVQVAKCVGGSYAADVYLADYSFTTGTTHTLKIRVGLDGTNTIRMIGNGTDIVTVTDSSSLITSGSKARLYGRYADIKQYTLEDSTSATPTLSSPTNGTPGSTSLSISATTDRVSDGTVYFLRRVGGSAASAATIVSTGESQAATGSTTQTRNMTGFTAGSSNNYVDIVQAGGGGNSNVVTAGPFTMASASVGYRPYYRSTIVGG